MTLLAYLVMILARGLNAAIELAVIFCLVRLLANRLRNRVLSTLEAIGRPLVDAMSDSAVRVFRRLRGSRVPSESERLSLIVLTLLFIHWMLDAIGATG